MASKLVTTTLKLDTCSYSDCKIYPGHGSAVFRRDGKTMRFQNSKCANLAAQSIKPLNLHWTTMWRREHRKAVTASGSSRRRTKSASKTQKAISGISIEDINKLKSMAAASTEKVAERPPLASNRRKTRA